MIVQTERGRVAGTMMEEGVAFNGIPYAAPPIGALRWRPPQPVPAWRGVRTAQAFGNDCMQLPVAGDATPLRTRPREDGLYLNVRRPADTAAHGFPVLVWIHGGGFVNGGSSLAIYDGARFAAHGIVFVSFNYRLGRFGFFAHPALAREAAGEPYGNYGFMDQLAALAWVQRNIGAFGGDPARVTIFGHSAGGESVHMLLTSPRAHGLFARAIVASGGGRTGFTPTRTLAEAEAIGSAFASEVGIGGDDAVALRALRGLPAQRIVHGLNMASVFAPGPITYSGPMVDGTIAPVAPEIAYARGAFARVPLLLGATSADGMPPPETPDPMRAHMLAAVSVGEPARYVARAFAAARQQVHLYRFGYVAGASAAVWNAGAPHGSELPFFFDTLAARYGAARTSQDDRVARIANAYVTNFAKTGDPNAALLARWPRFTRDTETLLDITAKGGFDAGPDPWREQLDLAAQLAETPH